MIPVRPLDEWNGDIMSIRLKRAYDDPAKNDGYRVLVDGIWPRGVSKEDIQLDDWFKDIAPSDELRKWFDHDPDRWQEFVERYHRELKDRDDLIEKLVDAAREGRLTLVFGAKDREHNNAVALKSYIQNKIN